MAPAFGAQLEVMDVDKPGVPTAWNLAAMLVAHEDGAASRWRDALAGARAHVGALCAARVLEVVRGLY